MGDHGRLNCAVCNATCMHAYAQDLGWRQSADGYWRCLGCFADLMVSQGTTRMDLATLRAEVAALRERVARLEGDGK